MWASAPTGAEAGEPVNRGQKLPLPDIGACGRGGFERRTQQVVFGRKRNSNILRMAARAGFFKGGERQFQN